MLCYNYHNILNLINLEGGVHLSNKVVITGMGSVLSRFGGVEGLVRILEEDICTLSEVPDMGPNGESIVGGIVEGEYLDIEGQSYKRFPKFVRMGIESAVEAVRQASISDLEGKRVTVLASTSTGGVKEVEYYSMLVREGRLKEFPIQVTMMCNNHSIATGVAGHFGIKHHALTVNDSCNAGMDAIYLGRLLLLSDETDVVIVTGADTPQTQGMVYSFAKTRSVKYGVRPEHVGIPFSKNSVGFAMSDGAASLVLEREEDVRSRGGRALASIEGIGISFDGVAFPSTDRSGSMLSENIRQVLEQNPSGVDYVNSQALGLRENDNIEVNNLATHFGSNVPITSIKGHIGQTFGAAPLLQVVASIISMERGFIPATLRTDLEGFEGYPIITETRHQPVERVLVTSHGFGGNNGALLLQKARG